MNRSKNGPLRYNKQDYTERKSVICLIFSLQLDLFSDIRVVQLY